MEIKQIGQFIKTMRKARNITQKELAAETGKSTSTIKRIMETMQEKEI